MTQTLPRRRLVLDVSPLRDSLAFRRIFVARTVSVLGLGMLAVAVPVQVFSLTASTLLVGVAAAVEGLAAFSGLLVGGAMADRFDRRTIILLSRVIGGIGFVALAVNAFLPAPALWPVFLVGAIDGFLGSLSVTALMAVTPTLVPRERLAAAGALNMLAVRLGTMVSPAIGGVVIVAGGVGWNYALAATGTLVTVLLLRGLPPLVPDGAADPRHPLRSIVEGAALVYRHRVVRSVVLLGTLETAAAGVRVLLPAFALGALGADAAATGLLYSAVPVGAVLASLLSGWIGRVARPGRWLLLLSLASFSALVGFGLTRELATSLLLLALFGALSSYGGVLQFALVQAHTPDRYLGRVNGLWMAQEVGGESAGSLLFGALGRALAPAGTVVVFGGGAVLLCAGALVSFRALRDAPGLATTEALA